MCGKSRSFPVCIVKTRGGSTIQSTQKLLVEWRSYVEDLFDGPSVTLPSDHIPVDIPSAEVDLDIDTDEFTLDELVRAIKQLNNNKYGGNDLHKFATMSTVPKLNRTSGLQTSWFPWLRRAT